MAVTRTTGGAGNDEDAGNGDVCVYAYVRVCLRVCTLTSYVYLCVDTRAARLVRPPIPGLPGTRATTTTAARTESKYGSMATLRTAVCATQE